MEFYRYFIFILFFAISSINSQKNWINNFTTNSTPNNLYQNTCQKGSLQSPVDLALNSSYYNSSLTIVSENYKNITPSQIRTSDMYINLTIPSDLGSIVLERYGYLNLYSLTDIRIKYPSEHSINGIKGSMEIQLIHKKVLGQIYPANQNIRIPDANMYLGISLIYSTNTSSINNSDNGFAQNFISAFKNISSPNVALNTYNITLGKRFFLYEGSDTNYPCDENFNWIVFSDFFNIDSNSLSTVLTTYMPLFIGPSNIKLNANLDYRPIFRNFKMQSNDTQVYVYPINSSSRMRVELILISIILLFLMN